MDNTEFEKKDEMSYATNADAELFVVRLLPILFDESVACFDLSAVKLNSLLATPSGWSEDDRSIRVGLADYLLDNFGYIRSYFIAEKSLREMLVACVKCEMELDFCSREKLIRFREFNKDPEKHPDEKMYVINLGSYDSGVANMINEKLAASMDKVEYFEDLIGMNIADLTEEDRMDIGFCVSNYMYLIRAFAKNGPLSQTVKSALINLLQVSWQSVFLKCDE